MSRKYRQIMCVLVVMLAIAAALVALNTKRDIDTTTKLNEEIIYREAISDD